MAMYDFIHIYTYIVRTNVISFFTPKVSSGSDFSSLAVEISVKSTGFQFCHALVLLNGLIHQITSFFHLCLHLLTSWPALVWKPLSGSSKGHGATGDPWVGGLCPPPQALSCVVCTQQGLSTDPSTLRGSARSRGQPGAPVRSKRGDRTPARPWGVHPGDRAKAGHWSGCRPELQRAPAGLQGRAAGERPRCGLLVCFGSDRCPFGSCEKSGSVKEGKTFTCLPR